jgi:hypothetical protein
MKGLSKDFAEGLRLEFSEQCIATHDPRLTQK